MGASTLIIVISLAVFALIFIGLDIKERYKMGNKIDKDKERS